MKVWFAIAALKKWATEFNQEEESEVVSLLSKLSNQLEQLPISQETKTTRPMGFVLISGEWWPCSALNEIKNGWVEYRVDEKDGSCSSGVAQPGKWAYCSADNTPSMPFC